MKLALQRIEVSISQRIIDGNCDFELLPCWHTEHGCWDELLMSGNLGIEEVAITVMEASPSSPESIISRLPKALLVWAIAVVYCGKSVAKIRFGSFYVRKATVEGKLKTRLCVE